MSNFFEDTSGKTRARQEKYRKKRKRREKKKLEQPISVRFNTKYRYDNEGLDADLKRWTFRDYLEEFLRLLPRDIEVVEIRGMEEGDSYAKVTQIFGSIVKEFRRLEASPRGICRSLYWIAKNIRAICKDMGLPSHPLSLRRLAAYRSTLGDKCRDRLLPVGTVDWFLASDSAKDEYTAEAAVRGSLVLIRILDEFGDEIEVYRYRLEEYKKHIANEYVLDVIEKAKEGR